MSNFPQFFLHPAACTMMPVLLATVTQPGVARCPGVAPSRRQQQCGHHQHKPLQLSEGHLRGGPRPSRSPLPRINTRLPTPQELRAHCHWQESRHRPRNRPTCQVWEGWTGPDVITSVGAILKFDIFSPKTKQGSNTKRIERRRGILPTHTVHTMLQHKSWPSAFFPGRQNS